MRLLPAADDLAPDAPALAAFLLGLPVTGVLWLLFRRFICTLSFDALRARHKGLGAAFLKGAFAPIRSEVLSHDLEVVHGALPPDLHGMYLRTGPNNQFEPKGGYMLFDGDAMIHAVRIRDGNAESYCNHWVRCHRFVTEGKWGEEIYMRIGDMRGLSGALMMAMLKCEPYNLPEAHYEPGNQDSQGNTALVYHNGSLLALNEACKPRHIVISPEGGLSTGEEFDFNGVLDHPFTAHPKIDPRTQEMVSFGYSVTKPFAKPIDVEYNSVSPDGTMSAPVPVACTHPQLLHDFAITEHYAIFVDQNLVLDPKAMLKKNSMPFVMNNKFNARVGVLSRKQPGDTRWFDIGRVIGWTPHFANAWEDGNTVHLVATQYDQIDLGSQNLTMGHALGRVVRISVDLECGSVAVTQLSDDSITCEFPTVAAEVVGQPQSQNAFVSYADVREENSVTFSGVIKIDMRAPAGRGEVGRIVLPQQMRISELSFVAKDAELLLQGHAPDDRGYLVGFATDEKTLESFFMVFDAETMNDEPVAQVRLPQRVPHGFHGMWLSEAQLQEHLAQHKVNLAEVTSHQATWQYVDLEKLKQPDTEGQTKSLDCD